LGIIKSVTTNVDPAFAPPVERYGFRAIGRSEHPVIKRLQQLLGDFPKRQLVFDQ
jgi:hypothetical protein